MEGQRRTRDRLSWTNSPRTPILPSSFCPPKLVVSGESGTDVHMILAHCFPSINLVAASVVVIYDQDFNPHNDRQAADRAYRIVSPLVLTACAGAHCTPGPRQGGRGHQVDHQGLDRREGILDRTRNSADVNHRRTCSPLATPSCN